MKLQRFVEALNDLCKEYHVQLGVDEDEIYCETLPLAQQIRSLYTSTADETFARLTTR